MGVDAYGRACAAGRNVWDATWAQAPLNVYLCIDMISHASWQFATPEGGCLDFDCVTFCDAIPTRTHTPGLLKASDVHAHLRSGGYHFGDALVEGLYLLRGESQNGIDE